MKNDQLVFCAAMIQQAEACKDAADNWDLWAHDSRQPKTPAQIVDHIFERFEKILAAAALDAVDKAGHRDKIMKRVNRIHIFLDQDPVGLASAHSEMRELQQDFEGIARAIQKEITPKARPKKPVKKRDDEQR